MSEFPINDVIFNRDASFVAKDAVVEFEKWLTATKQLPGAMPPETITISNLSISPTTSHSLIVGSATNYIIQTITTGPMHNGAIIYLSAASAGYTVTLRSGGNISTTSDITLSTDTWISLQRVGNVWKQIKNVAVGPQTNAIDWRTSSVTIYVRTDGNNSNDGFTNSAPGAVRDWTGVFEVIRKINIRNANITVAFQAGLFTGTVITGEQFQGSGNKTLLITGIAGETLFSSNFSVYGGVSIDVTNIEFNGIVYSRDNAKITCNTCTFNNYLSVFDNGIASLTSCTFKGATTPAIAMGVRFGGVIRINTGITFSGAFTAGLESYGSGNISTSETNNIPINFNNASFSNTFLNVGINGGGGQINLRGIPVVTGTAIGIRYKIYAGGKVAGITKEQLDSLAIGTLPGVLSSGASITSSGTFISGGTSSASGYLLANGTDAFEPVRALQTRTITTTAPLTGGGDLSANRTLGVSTATTSATGVVQLATTTEATTGTDTTKAVNPAGLSSHVASKIAGLATAASVTTLGTTVANHETRIATLETSGTGTTVTINPNGGLQNTAEGLGIRLDSEWSGLSIGANGISVIQATYSAPGAVITYGPNAFEPDPDWPDDTYQAAPNVSAHQNIVNRVVTLENSIGDISTALAAILRV